MTEDTLLMRPNRFLRTLRRDTRGAIMIEFAFVFPVMLAMGMYGVDTANLAITNLRLNQIALNLADNSSRVGATSNLSKQQMRVVDVEDVFIAAQKQGNSVGLTDNGRVILTSLERDSTGTQKIHWQRCFGNKTGATYESHFGKVKNTDGDQETDTNGNGVIDASEIQNGGQAASAGIGDPVKVSAPTNDSGVMFVEINYRYTPMFPWLFTATDLSFTASFIVRDKRDFSQLYNAKTSTSYECGYTAREAPPV